MTNLILTIAIISFGTLFGMSLITMRKLEIENRKLRKENAEMKWNQIKV
ncbi:MAG: hypothetical protein ACO25L_06900 [Candidatus Nanopelagicales bacterium]|jgi:hypothetical protein